MAAVCEITILYGFLFDNDKGLTLLGGGQVVSHGHVKLTECLLAGYLRINSQQGWDFSLHHHIQTCFGGPICLLFHVYLVFSHLGPLGKAVIVQMITCTYQVLTFTVYATVLPCTLYHLMLQCS